MPRILITGASIAGNTTAFWLARRGFEVVVLEREPEFRDGGQNIDVRGVGREALQRMGLEQDALDAGTGDEGTAWVNDKGEPVAEFLAEDTEGDGPTAEMEILRGDLARLLYEAADGGVDFRFGDHVVGLEDDGKGVTVRFDKASDERFDAVIVAEGVGSSTRELLFPGQNDPRWMDLTIAYFTIPRTQDDDRLWRWYHATEGRSVSLRPDRHGTTRAMLTVQKPQEGEQDWSVGKQKAWLTETFGDVGWEARRVLSAMASADDFYFDVVRQVRLPRWSSGRVALTGDAAWCATPLAGIGSTLAVTGGYVLAGELALAESIEEGLAAYEAAMRPMVEKGQGVPKIGPRLMNPHTRVGIRLLHGALKIASRPPVRDVAAKLIADPPEGPDLSRYDGDVRAAS